MSEKEVDWRGSSREDLLSFPSEVRRTAGFEIGKIQNGLNPTDWKPIPSWGAGIIEIKLSVVKDQYRVVYVAKFEERIYVLHCFQKKAQATSMPDVDIIKMRYRDVVNERRKTKND